MVEFGQSYSKLCSRGSKNPSHSGCEVGWDKIAFMLTFLKKWGPALIVMSIIFLFSSQPSNELPSFDWADTLVKKGGHMLGYGLLSASYSYAMKGSTKRYWLAWTLTILYAITDEIHQSFVPGRHASMWDVLFFDNLGAVAALLFDYHRFRRASAIKTRSQETSDSR